MLDAGVSRAEIAAQLGVSRPTVSYHARRLGYEMNQRCARHYDWQAIRRAYESGLSARECRKEFGFSRQA